MNLLRNLLIILVLLLIIKIVFPFLFVASVIYDVSDDMPVRMRSVIDYWWERDKINDTHGWINLTYVDSTKKTSFIEYWINLSIYPRDSEGRDSINVFYANSTYPCADGEHWKVSVIMPANNTTYIMAFSAVHPDYPQLR
jgi:hypothetical protein